MKKTIALIFLVLGSFNISFSQTWSPLGSGMNNGVNTLMVYNGDLVAGGLFTTADNLNANRIAKWNGTNWSTLGSGMDSAVYALSVYNNELIAAGWFTNAGGVSCNRIAKWNGTAWSPLGGGFNDHVLSLTIFNNELIAAGYFTTAGGVTANRIARWNGTSWSPLGSGLGGTLPLGNRPFSSGLVIFNNELIVSGSFRTAGSVSANSIAKWDGTTWSTFSSGVGDNTYTLAVYNNELIAGGESAPSLFYGIAKWNGVGWVPLISELAGSAFSLIIFNNEMITGGWFNIVGGINAKNIAKWNGTGWSTLGSGMNAYVRGLTIYNNSLIACGNFDTAGGVVTHKIAKWWIPFSVSGQVRYSDNNQPAINGYVKAFKLDGSTGNIITFDSAQIQNDGSYTLSNVPQDSLDIGVYPNSTTNNDWVITYYPSTTYWQGATTLYPTGNLTNINVGAIRLTATTNSNSVNGKVLRLTDAQIGNLKDAVLYAKNGNTFVRCGVSDGNGVYHLPSLPSGSLKIICNRIGFTNDSAMVTVTPTSNIDSINFHLYRIPVGIKQISENVPSEYKLYQNYPNPFNPSTIIRFQIKDSRYTMIKVYNILGKEVTTLVNEKKSPGTYEVTFDGNGLASGIYFYTLAAGEFKATKRFVLVK